LSDLTYALITPVRDERENLSRLADCVASQTRAPAEWLIVDNGSTDRTLELIRELEASHTFVRGLATGATAAPEPGTPIVRAFHAGIDSLTHSVDVVVKLDGDVSFEPDYFAKLLAAMAEDERLGIISGECLEEVGGAWQVRPVTEGHARGATRAYRRECLDAVLPLPERFGWDTVDEVKANVLGWKTGTIPGVCFYHHRPVGARDGAPWARWVRQGGGAHYLGYRFSYVLARTLHRARRNPAALGMLVGYGRALAQRSERHPDPAVINHLRSRQSIHRLPNRAREALGKRRGSVGA
jgi:glycosyltransferase involved in cell wall biosynthesis